MDVRQKLEQLRRSKKKGNKPNKANNPGKTNNVKDLRQIIAKKTKKKVPKTRDLRETNKKLTSRRKPSSSVTRNERPVTRLNKRTVSQDQAGPHQYQPQQQYQQQQYYVPPPMRHNQPAYAMMPQVDPRRPNPVVSPPVAPRQSNASILISNLHPKITQSEIIELCSDIGPMSGLNFINQTTVIATFQNSSDAVKAVKIYNNRLLDGRPMLVNMMPNLV